MPDETNVTPSQPDSTSTAQTLGYAVPHEAEIATDRMTRGDIACMAMRIMGIYAIVQSLPMLAVFFGDMRIGVGNLLAAAVPCVLCAGTGVALLMFSQDLSRWLLPRTAVTATEPPGHGPAQLQAIAFSIVGLVVFTTSLPSLLYVVARVFTTAKGGLVQLNPLAHLEGFLPSLLHYGVQCALGIWLFFGSKRLSTWWWSLRHPEYREVA